MPAASDLKRVVPESGRSLYLTVKDHVRGAIDAGILHPEQQLRSTKELSAILGVSLVTVHRALTELVDVGVLRRAQGKGTFVHQGYLERNKTACDVRVGLVFHREASLADYYHSQVLEGIHRAAQSMEIDLILLRFGDDARNGCDGYLYVNPLPQNLDRLAAESSPRHPGLVVGARSNLKRLCHIDVDNVALAKQAVAHLLSLGHTRIAYIGGGDDVSHTRDRWTGFQEACAEADIAIKPAHVIRPQSLWLENGHLEALDRALKESRRPTAIFAAGYYFALQAYSALASRGLRVPEDLSVIGVDDPRSAAHLWPPLTTMRQPLFELGQLAMSTLAQRIRRGRSAMETRQLFAELIIRESTAPMRSQRPRN